MFQPDLCEVTFLFGHLAIWLTYKQWP